MSGDSSPRRVAIVGGGLAGLAAAAALAGRGHHIELFEARRALGGRAASFYDPTTGEVVDHCQHVSMGCCTNLADFCRRTGIDGCFRRDRVLHFFGPDGRRNDFAGSHWLPAPLHLGPSFLRLSYLSLGERVAAMRGLWKLARLHPSEHQLQTPIGAWLAETGQPARAIDRFWNVVLVSALSESLDRITVAAARQVFVEGFMANRRSYEVEVPEVPLAELYGERMLAWLASQRIAVRLGTPVREIKPWGQRVRLTLAGADELEFDDAICAVTWRRAAELLSDEVLNRTPGLAQIDQIESAPISGVHLWFDRELSELPHAVLVGRLSQWVFRRSSAGERGHYYQVVISASRDLAGRDRDSILDEVCNDLRAIWPAAHEAWLLHGRVVTDQEAVFSIRPGASFRRPSQRTAVDGITLAGDWTDTGWPSTMEGAVLSGYLAAELLVARRGAAEKFVQPPLPRSWLTRLLFP